MVIVLRPFLLFISTFIFFSSAFSQNQKRRGSLSSWKDTTFIRVKLIDTIYDNKVAAIDLGNKAIIYLKVRPLLLEAKERVSQQAEFSKTIHYFDSASLKSDTIFVSEYFQLYHLEYLISHQLIQGNANVYYKKEKTFVDSISHRLERYGGEATRFFYLPDKRPFFGVLEMIGILDPGEIIPSGRYGDYRKEGEKLQNLRKE